MVESLSAVLHIRISPETYNRLQEVAIERGKISISDLARELIEGGIVDEKRLKTEMRYYQKQYEERKEKLILIKKEKEGDEKERVKKERDEKEFNEKVMEIFTPIWKELIDKKFKTIKEAEEFVYEYVKKIKDNKLNKAVTEKLLCKVKRVLL